MPSPFERSASSLIATGSAIDVELGYSPTWVRLLNTSGLATLEWNAGFADGTGLKTVTDGTMSLIGSGTGITPTATGFTIGADADVNVNEEIIRYIALY